jgi:N-methylhydantoinase B
MSSVALGGSRPDGSHWTYYETIGGGSGATVRADGASAVQCHMTNTLNTPAEAIELQYPLRVRRFERAIGTGGAGNRRGGDGTVRELEALADCEGTILSDRRTTPPYGLAGGLSGRAGANARIGAEGLETRLPGKGLVMLQAGDVLQIRTPGGGGVGVRD